MRTLKQQVMAIATTFVGLLVLLPGCKSMRTVIVDIDFDVDIKGVDSAGKEWRAALAELTRQRADQAASPFSYTRYVGKLFEWRIQVGPTDLGYFFSKQH